MELHSISLLVLLAPLAFVLTAIYSYFQPGLRPKLTKNVAMAAALISIVTAVIGSFYVVQYGLLESATIGIQGLGFSIRLDAVSIIMYAMIAIIAFIVLRYSLNYLDGDDRQGRFIGRMAATIAAVQLLVLAGNLGLILVSWILTSVSLHRLLVFYRERPGAISAARKKFVVARLGDIFLSATVVLLYTQFGTGNLELIFQELKLSIASGVISTNVEAAALFLVMAAMLKSAQFPSHAWLIEVMETPTPVSALLHAGLLNAGPFLVLRLAFLMEASSYAAILIVVVGGFTALFASLAFLTQTSVKIALGYSSVAHMGFSLMVCGLGVYPAAMLHLVAHSFYKAHSFLSSGSVIDVLRASKVKKLTRTGSPLRIILGIVLGILIYVGFAFLYGINSAEELSLLAIGAIMIMGLFTIFTTAVDSNGSFVLFLRASLLAMVVAAAFFALESIMHYLLGAQVPALMQPDTTELILIAIITLTFGTVAFLQILAPLLASKPKYRALAIHIRNGFYANTLFDRFIGSLEIINPKD